ncbi:replication factor C subunit 1 [Dionaea muscipula]
MQGDIRKWFMKKHDQKNGAVPKPAEPTLQHQKPAATASEHDRQVDRETTGRRKTSKYFDKDHQKPKTVKEVAEVSTKRKGGEDLPSDVKIPPAKKVHKVKNDADDDGDDDGDFVTVSSGRKSVGDTSNKRLKSGSGRGVPLKTEDVDESDHEKDTEPPPKSGGRGRGGRGGSTTTAGGRGRGGGGRGGFMNFGERNPPPHKGEKEVPEGAPDCLAGLTFVISGTLDSLEREDAEDLIKRYGGRVTGSVSKKTDYLLCDEDVEGRKSAKAKELGTPFLTEDGLFDKIRASNRSRTTPKKPDVKVSRAVPEKSPKKVVAKKDLAGNASSRSVASTASSSGAAAAAKPHESLTWTEKYRPKVPDDVIGNRNLITQLHDWLSRWNEQFLHSKGKGKKNNDSAAKKAVLLSGTPGIGKTTSAKLVSQMLGFLAIEVNASDNRGKADAKIGKGISGSMSNSVKELVSNESMSVDDRCRSKHQKTVLIMDEVDGMSAGDRGGVADLIASIKISKIPIICICNDRYSQKLKSLVNYCFLLNFRKPTKQQMAKRLLQIANAEGLKVNEIALEELAARCNGDMRMALNQLQYMNLSMSVINYDDIRKRLLSSAKDEDISPFTAVDKLFGFDGGKLRMDERLDLSMSDPDLVPLLVQENYLNYMPKLAGNDENGIKRMDLIARAAESIADGDIFNVQIRRYRQWQLSQSGSLSSCIIPAALMHGGRKVLEEGEKNFNRFGGWLGKNSTMGKNFRLLDDLHVHVIASRLSSLGRAALRMDYLSLLLKELTVPLHKLPKEEAVRRVVEFMDSYSISQEDFFDTIVELSKFKGHPSPLDGIPPAVKAALTKAYKEGSSARLVRTADLVSLPGMKKAPKKRIAAILEPASDEPVEQEAGDVEEAESEAEDTSDTEGTIDTEKLQMDLESNHGKGILVQVDLKGAGSSGSKKPPAGKGKGGSEAASKRRTGQGSGSGSKRKR